MKISEYSNTGKLQTGDLFFLSNPSLSINSTIYAKDTLSGLFSTTTNFRGIDDSQFNNELWLKTQMGAIGQFKHANNSHLNNFREKLAGTGLIQVIIVGDGYVGYGNGLFGEVINNLLVNYGTGGFGYKTANLTVINSNNKMTLMDSISNSSDVYLEPHYAITQPDGFLTYGHGLSQNSYLSNTQKIYFVSNTGAGSFTISTGETSSVLFRHTGINASGSTREIREITVNYGNSRVSPYISISGSGNTSFLEIPFIISYNSTASSGRIVFSKCSQDGGITYEHFGYSPGSFRNQVRDKIWSGINPDLILVESSSPLTTNCISGARTFMDDIKLKWPNTTMIVCGTFPINADLSPESGNSMVRDFALKKQFAYFDGYNVFGTGNWRNRGYDNLGYHFTTEGGQAYGKLLWS